MDRILIIGTNSNFPRASAAVNNSGAVPDSACGGPAHPDETRFFVPRKAAGRPPPGVQEQAF